MEVFNALYINFHSSLIQFRTKPPNDVLANRGTVIDHERLIPAVMK